MNASMLCQLSVETENLTDGSNDLLARAQGGDGEAFNLIFVSHHRFIYKFIYAMVGEQSLAEELTQETFLGAYRGICSLRGESKLRTWLCGIAKNTVYKFLRSQRREGTKSADAVESFDLVDERNLPPDEEFLSRELNQRIEAALAGLDADKRLIFVLKELQQLSYHEISEITGHSIPKLKTDLHRAKARMQIVLRPYLEVSDELL